MIAKVLLRRRSLGNSDIAYWLTWWLALLTTLASHQYSSTRFAHFLVAPQRSGFSPCFQSSRFTIIMGGIYRTIPVDGSSLPTKSASVLCQDYLLSFCRHGDQCPRSHEICLVEEDIAGRRRVNDPAIPARNVLCMEDRLIYHGAADMDGAGRLSTLGPRHDNDYVNIEDINILPTTDEILCLRPPYIPAKDSPIPVDSVEQRNRLVEIGFRQLRYDNVESIIDISYHAAQQCVRRSRMISDGFWDDHVETPKGNQYFVYQNIAFMELDTMERRGITVPVSFDCPKALRGGELDRKGRLEKGMLVAMIGIDRIRHALSVTFMEILSKRSSTNMKTLTGHDRRAAVTLAFINDDESAVRRILYNASGLLSESFVLIEFPKVLLAGFQWCLKRLQHFARASKDFAFASQLAEGHHDVNDSNKPPEYALKNHFEYNLQSLRSDTADDPQSTFKFHPSQMFESKEKEVLLGRLRNETTLDDGQAAALCESLCRRLAFTQGPPGTGKTYLGVSMVKVLLASRPTHDQKPILVVCMTNHALDNFLDDLRDQGIAKLARLGRGSKEEWTQSHGLFSLARRTRKSPNERQRMKLAGAHCDSMYFEMMAQAPCIGLGGADEGHAFATDDMNNIRPSHQSKKTTKVHSWETITWSAVRDHLEKHHPMIYNNFAQIESIQQNDLSTARLARKASGFAFEFWLHGGDLKDMQNLLNHFHWRLGRDQPHLQDDMRARFDIFREKLTNKIASNVQLASDICYGSSKLGDVWSMNLEERQMLVHRWREEIGPRAIPDRLVEVHRRYLGAVDQRNRTGRSIEARCLLQQDIIGATTTGCAKDWELLNSLNLHIVICEEAGEVIEGQSLCTLLPTIQHGIFIGDPQQLRPQVTQQLMSSQSSAKFRLDESLFERLTTSRGSKSALNMSRLNLQRRMHPEVSELVREISYPKLRDHPSTSAHPEIAGMADRVYWFDHEQPEDDDKSKSFSNSFEVQMTSALVEYLINTNEYDFGDIAVLTPYNGQLAALRQRLMSTCEIWLCQADKINLERLGLLMPEQMESFKKTETSMSSLLRLATIDNFQGEEAKIVILSTVRSNAKKRVGFLKTPNRINVSCSRARDGFYIIGNATLMRNAEMWNRIIGLLEARSKIGRAFKLQCHRHPLNHQSISSSEKFSKAKKCLAICGEVLSCGHACRQSCHAPSLHERIGCKELVEATCERCNHRHTRQCYENSGICESCASPGFVDTLKFQVDFDNFPQPHIGYGNGDAWKSLQMTEPGPQMTGIVDRALASIEVQMRTLEREVHRAEIEIAQSRHEFRYSISTDPLAEAVNEQRIRERISYFEKIWYRINKFVGKSFRPNACNLCDTDRI